MSAGLSDSPKGPVRLRRRPLATAVVEVLKTIEGPETSIACSLYGGWGSGKTQFTNILVDEMKSTLEEKEYPTLKPPLPFIWMCNLFGCAILSGSVAAASIMHLNHTKVKAIKKPLICQKTISSVSLLLLWLSNIVNISFSFIRN